MTDSGLLGGSSITPKIDDRKISQTSKEGVNQRVTT